MKAIKVSDCEKMVEMTKALGNLRATMKNSDINQVAQTIFNQVKAKLTNSNSAKEMYQLIREIAKDSNEELWFSAS